jgi:hypothetical protein
VAAKLPPDYYNTIKKAIETEWFVSPICNSGRNRADLRTAAQSSWESGGLCVVQFWGRPTAARCGFNIRTRQNRRRCPGLLKALAERGLLALGGPKASRTAVSMAARRCSFRLAIATGRPNLARDLAKRAKTKTSPDTAQLIPTETPYLGTYRG